AKRLERNWEIARIWFERSTYLCCHCTADVSRRHDCHCLDYRIWRHACCKWNNEHRLPRCLSALSFPNHYADYHLRHVLYAITKGKGSNRKNHQYIRSPIGRRTRWAGNGYRG